jgi:peptidoglycan-N-acetylmuramic acid deacetylase
MIDISKEVYTMFNKFIKVAAGVCAACMIMTGVGVSASEGWYFKKNGNKQPGLDSGQRIIEKYGGIYIDTVHGDDNPEKVIYLTFDAGYENGNVEKTLDVLKEKQVPGAFFVLAHVIEDNTDLVKRMFDEGHTVCNHSANHKNMSDMTFEDFAAEISALEQLCRECTGYELAKFFRPPEGTYSESCLDNAKKLGYRTVFWSFAYQDWDNNKQPDPAASLAKIKENIHNGEILLLHPTSATNAAILGNLIDYLRAEGYRFGKLEEIG